MLAMDLLPTDTRDVLICYETRRGQIKLVVGHLDPEGQWRESFAESPIYDSIIAWKPIIVSDLFED